jgi:oxygen-dependent protoporphyrinogen oxidase
MRIIVIGAGLAGLTAAWRLRALGHEVTVFEAEPKAGGRMADATAGPIAYNAGARLIYDFGGDLFALLAELDLTGALIPLKGLAASCLIDGREHRLPLLPGPATLAMPGLTLADRLRLLRLAARMLRLRRRANPDDLLSMRDHDDETLATWADRELGPRLRARLIDPIFRGTRAWNAAEISPAFLLATLPHMLGQRRVFVLRGGMGRLTRELAARLGVRHARPVTTVAEEAAACHVTLADGSRHSADLAVIATPHPLPLLAAPKPQQAEFLAALRYNRLAILHLAVGGELRPLMRFLPGSPLIATYQQLPAAAGRPAQIYCQLTPEASLSDEPLLPRLLPELRLLLPDVDSRLLASHEQRIARKLPTPYPGYLAHLARFRAWQDATPTRIALCGDYLTAPLLGGAAHAGAAAARRIALLWPLHPARRVVA